MQAEITEPQIARLVDRFYAVVRQDPVIGPLFNETIEDWDSHLATLKRFWSSVMLTSGRYKGDPMSAHLRLGPRIAPELFDRWLALWAETTEAEIGGAAALAFRRKAERIAESLQLALYYRPAERRRAACG